MMDDLIRGLVLLGVRATHLIIGGLPSGFSWTRYIGRSKPSVHPVTAARKYQHSYQVRAGYWTRLIPLAEKSWKTFALRSRSKDTTRQSHLLWLRSWFVAVIP